MLLVNKYFKYRIFHQHTPKLHHFKENEMSIKINTTCNSRKSIILKIQLKMCMHPEFVKSVAAAWGMGTQVNLTGWGLMG